MSDNLDSFSAGTAIVSNGSALDVETDAIRIRGAAGP